MLGDASYKTEKYLLQTKEIGKTSSLVSTNF